MDHEHFMRLALAEARQALEAKEFPVGCVLVGEGKVLATGRRSHSGGGQANELDHAEISLLRDIAVRFPGLDLAKTTLYSTMEPCLMCFSTLILNGVRHVVYAYEDVMGGGTNLPLHQLAPLYRDMRVTVTANVLRSESLSLFKQFFTDPGTPYWHDSLLARYTLAQSETESLVP